MSGEERDSVKAYVKDDVKNDVKNDVRERVNGEPSLSRRGFIRHVETGVVTALCSRIAAAALLPLAMTACGGARFVAASRIGGQLVVQRRDMGTTGSALVDAPELGLPLHVRRDDDGAFVAVSTRCMHRGCQVDAAADRLVCPCHGSEYTFDGRVLKGPTEQPLVRYRVTSDDERVYIHVDAPLREERDR